MPCGTKTCGLCTFTFERGESVILLMPDTGLCTDRSFPYYPCDDPGCLHERERGVTMHEECIEAVLSPPSSEMCRLTHTESELNVFEQALYMDEVRANLAKNTTMRDAATTVNKSKLRQELAQMMVSHQPTYNSRRYQGEVSLKEPIYAIRVQFLGETYIAELTNTQPEPDHQPIYEPETDGEMPAKIYFGQNQFGIKTILIVFKNDILEVEDDPLLKWEDITPGAGDKFWYHGDGHKMRSLRRVENPIPGPRPAKAQWPVPMENSLGFFQHRLSGLAPPLVRFQGVPVNGDDITGYSVACTKGGALWIESHSSRRRHNCYEADDVFDLRWHYIAVSPGEKLAELWRRDRRSDSGHPELIFVTSFRKTHVIGPYVDPDVGPRYTYTIIEHFPPEKHDIYFNIEGNRIVELAIPFDSTEQERLLGKPKASTARPPTASNRPFFLSVAPLDDIITIQVCIIGDVITGLLLHYADRTRASVGQVKLNRLQPHVRVERDRQLSFRIHRQRIEAGEAFCFNQMQTIPRELSDLRNDWVDIPCYGMLEFWWSESGNVHLGWMPSESPSEASS